MKRHTDYENMVAAYDGLSPAERRELDAHLAECSACAADLAEYRRMDSEIQSARALKASAGLRVRFSSAISGAINEASAPAPVRPIAREPVIRKARRQPQPWTWTRALAPIGFVLLFALAIGLSLPRANVGNRDEVWGQSAAAPPNQAAMVKLTFTCEAVGGFVGYNNWNRVLAEFEAENPDIDVDFTPASIIGRDAASYEQAVAEMAGKTDVFCAAPTPNQLQRGFVADLALYIANDPLFNPDDFYPGLLHGWKDGAVLSIPTYFRPMMISYNPQLFSKAGVAQPQPGWTWNDFLATATALTQRNGDEVAQWGYYEIGAGLFSARLWSHAAADAIRLPDYATTAETLRWYEKLYVEARAANLPPSLNWVEGQEYNDRSAEGPLKAGKVAMWDDGWLQPNRGTRHLLAVPSPSAGLYSRLSDLVMSGRTAHPDEAWRLISYLSQHLPDGEVPARRSLAEKASFWNRLDEASTAAYRDALSHPAASWTELPKGHDAYWEAAVAVAKGEKTAEQALADLDAQVKLRGGPAERAEAARAEAEAAPVQPVQTVTTETVTATPPPPPAARPADATVITFACYRNRLPYYTQAVKAFEAANPGVYVDLKPLEDFGAQFGQGETTLQQSLEGVAAQVDALCDDNLPTRVRTGEGLDQYRDLAPFIAADPSVDLSDYFDGALDPVQEGGRTWGLPRGLWISMIYYNQAAFRQAGVAQPQPGWTWDDFLAAAKSLTVQKDDGSVRWGFTELWRAGTPFLRSHNPDLLAEGLSGLTAPDTQAALQWYVDLIRAHQVMPVPEWYQGAQYVGTVGKDRALESKTAMYSGIGGGLLLDSSNWRTLLGVVPYPVATLNDRTTPLEYSADAVVVTAGTRHPEEAWRWLVTASKVVALSEGRGVPARRSVLEAMRGASRVDANVYAAYEYALTHLMKPSRLAPPVEKALYDAIRAAVVDGKPVDVALQEAAQGR